MLVAMIGLEISPLLLLGGDIHVAPERVTRLAADYTSQPPGADPARNSEHFLNCTESSCQAACCATPIDEGPNDSTHTHPLCNLRPLSVSAVGGWICVASPRMSVGWPCCCMGSHLVSVLQAQQHFSMCHSRSRDFWEQCRCASSS